MPDLIEILLAICAAVVHPEIMSTKPFVVNHDGKKHNIEHFLRFHPGGTNTLSVLRNVDVTDRLLATHHSAAAYELLKDYRVDDGDPHKYVREDGDLEVSVWTIL